MAQAMEMSAKQKAAVLLISLGPNVSAQILKHLNEEEIEKLTLEIANQRKLTQEQKDKVIHEFHEMCLAKEYLSSGGLEYARDILEKRWGWKSHFHHYPSDFQFAKSDLLILPARRIRRSC